MNRRLRFPPGLLIVVAACLLVSPPAPAQGHAPTGQATTLFLPIVVNNYGPGVLFADNFSSPDSGWFVNNTATTQWRYEGGEYELLVRQPYRFALSMAPVASPSDYEARVTAYRNGGTAATIYGLTFGYVDSSRHYVFGINSATQSYALWRVTPEGGTAVRVFPVPWTASSVILPGDGKNVLAVRRQGTQITLYVNGNLLANVTDANYVGNLDVGLYVESSATAPVSARFDDFRLLRVGSSVLAEGLRASSDAERGVEGPLPTEQPR